MKCKIFFNFSSLSVTCNLLLQITNCVLALRGDKIGDICLFSEIVMVLISSTTVFLQNKIKTAFCFCQPVCVIVLSDSLGEKKRFICFNLQLIDFQDVFFFSSPSLKNHTSDITCLGSMKKASLLLYFY